MRRIDLLVFDLRFVIAGPGRIAGRGGHQLDARCFLKKYGIEGRHFDGLANYRRAVIFH